VLIKGANYLDVLAKLDTVVFDKTGTLTKGTFQVTEVRPAQGYTRQELLETAAKMEAASPHPIAASILRAYARPVDAQAIEAYEEIAGHGVKGILDGQETIVGNDSLLHREGIPHDPAVCHLPGTTVQVAQGGHHLGYVVISDEIKEDAPQVIDALKRLGVRRTEVLTGDEWTVAERVAKVVGIDETRAGLLPEDKVSRVESLVAGHRRGALAFVGDGINDAPVLTRADVGIAMGGLGSDAALEAADVVIMDDALGRLPVAVQVARRTRAIVLQNITFALGVKGVFMVLGAMGHSGIWMAVFADVGVALLAVLNSTRVLAFKPER
jgi:Cd2+/Zn2+-exporting ATPase